MVESWLHFPRARHRLLAMLRATSPRGLIVASGDVHHAEMLDSFPSLTNQTAPLWEVRAQAVTAKTTVN